MRCFSRSFFRSRPKPMEVWGFKKVYGPKPTGWIGRWGPKTFTDILEEHYDAQWLRAQLNQRSQLVYFFEANADDILAQHREWICPKSV